MLKTNWSAQSTKEQQLIIVQSEPQTLMNMTLKATNYGDGREKITSAWLPTKSFATASAEFKPNIFKILCNGISITSKP